MADVKGTFDFTVRITTVVEPISVQASYLTVVDGDYQLKGEDHQVIFSCPKDEVIYMRRGAKV